MKKLSKKQLVSLIIVIVILAGGGFWAYKHNARSNRQQPLITKNGTTSNGTSKNSSQGQGGAVDQKGTSSNAQSSSAPPATSPSGNITLQQPTSGATLKSGDTISGTAKVDIVQFRLIDNSVGVIAQGQLRVAGGNFAGSLQFQNKAAGGRLDVFSLDPSSGAEINEVQIPVNF